MSFQMIERFREPYICELHCGATPKVRIVKNGNLFWPQYRAWYGIWRDIIQHSSCTYGGDFIYSSRRFTTASKASKYIDEILEFRKKSKRDKKIRNVVVTDLDMVADKDYKVAMKELEKYLHD